MERVILFGNGRQAQLIYFYLTHSSPYEVVAFTVDRGYITEDRLFELPVVAFEDIESIYSPDQYKMSVQLGYRNLNMLRAEKYAQAKAKGYELISYISPKATTWPGLIVGDNCFISENTSIGPFAEIGNNVCVGIGTVIGHHCVIRDHCFLGTHVVILGSATIEPYCFLGPNSVVRDGGITIARESIIGAGVYIGKDTKEKGVYVNRPPDLLPKPSNELSAWLTWPLKPLKPRSASGTEEDQKK